MEQFAGGAGVRASGGMEQAGAGYRGMLARLRMKDDKVVLFMRISSTSYVQK